MRLKTYLVALLCLTALDAYAATVPVKDSRSAIAIAKAICRDAQPQLRWEAKLSGDHWDVDTVLSDDDNGATWSAEIPVNGSAPDGCVGGLDSTIDFKPWTPDAKSISALESAVKIPGDDGRPPIPLNQYARYYDGSIIRGHHFVGGDFVFPQDPDDKPAGVYIWTGRGNYPRSLAIDGGCNIVHVSFDVEAKSITSIRCNEIA
jgi:hypothetical protein